MLVSYKKDVCKEALLGSLKSNGSSLLSFSSLRKYTLFSYKDVVYKKVVRSF